jgi:hypothetical protein
LLNSVVSIFNAGAAAAGDYESIATVTVGSGGQSSVSFTSIPATYKHLQIRAIMRGTRAVTDSEFSIRVNSDSGSNYAFHYLRGNGSTASASAGSSVTNANIGINPGANATASIYAVMVMDVLDYADTNKYKTFRTLNGYDGNGAGSVYFDSALWQSTSAITGISFSPSANNWEQYSHFALYGIKGA